MTNTQHNKLSDVAKAGQIDRLLVRLKSGQTLEEALKAEQCRQWFYKLSEIDRAPVIAIEREQQQKVIQSKSLENSAMVWVSLTPDQKSQFQRMCEVEKTTVPQRLNTLIVADLNAFLDRESNAE